MPLANHALVHPKRLASLNQAGWFPSTVTVQLDTPTRALSGSQQRGWANVTGLVGLPCRVMLVSATERRLPSYVSEDTTHEVLLAGVYNNITSAQQIVVAGVNAGTYQLTAPAETDGNGSLTRLYVRAVGGVL